MCKTMIISPSGNFYGSEQVLWEYLMHSRQRSVVFVPRGSLLYGKLKASDHGHVVKTFDAGRPAMFYARVLLLLLTGRVRNIYLNEAGHNRYILLLARLFRKRSFTIHVRMAEDAQPGRWPRRRAHNVEVVAISRYVEQILPFASRLMYDPYNFPERKLPPERMGEDRLVVGIIGRVTATKGLGRLASLAQHLHERGERRIIFHLFGDVSREADRAELDRIMAFGNVRAMGFRESKEEIYNNIDCVLHLSVEEALGRIFFEAIDHGKPFLGFRAAGIEEIGGLSGLDDLLADPGDGWMEVLCAKMELLGRDYAYFAGRVIPARETMAALLSMEIYVEKIDKLISR